MGQKPEFDNEQIFRTLMDFVNVVEENTGDYHIFVTGSLPFSESELRKVVSTFCQERLMTDEEIDWSYAVRYVNGAHQKRYEEHYDHAERFIRWVDIVVIGHEDFNEDFLTYSLQHADNLQYMAQEEFLAYLLKGNIPEYTDGDPRIFEHEGLSYLASIGFQWPSTEAEPNPEPVEVNESGWKAESDLRVMGYTVRRGVSVITRRKVLAKAVDELGLYDVATKVAWFARNAKMRHDNKMEGAIERWEYDLAWLKTTYYDSSTHRFVWPNTRNW